MRIFQIECNAEIGDFRGGLNELLGILLFRSEIIHTTNGYALLSDSEKPLTNSI
jgi:hypothetical protein